MLLAGHEALPRKAAEALDLAARLCRRLDPGVAESSEILCDGELVEGNRDDRPLRAHQLRSALAVSGQDSEVLFELLRPKALLTVAGEDRPKCSGGDGLLLGAARTRGRWCECAIQSAHFVIGDPWRSVPSDIGWGHSPTRSGGNRMNRHLPSPAMGVGVVALILALAGSAVALPGKSSVNGGDIKSESIKSRHLKDGKVTSVDIGDGQVTAADVEEALRPGPQPLWAVVRAFGLGPSEIVAQRNTIGIEDVEEGVYELRFNRSVAECSFTATPRGGNTIATVINTALNPPAGLDAEEVRVSLNDNSGNPADRDFSVQILC